jgi:hypothetical protein
MQPDRTLLDFLQTFLTELIGRYAHLRQFVEEAKRELRGGTPNLLFHYENLLSSRLKVLQGFTPTLADLPEGTWDVDALEQPFEFLVTQSAEFQSLHKALRWFPTPWPESGLFQFLTQLCREKRIERQFRQMNATAVFSDEYNFLTSDVNQHLPTSSERSNLVVWALPKCENANPLLWPVLAHEIAHSLYKREELIENLKDKLPRFHDPTRAEVLKSWAMELNADLFAQRMFGPAYVYSVIYFSIFFTKVNLRAPVEPERDRGRKGFHPPLETRIRLLSKETKSKRQWRDQRLQKVWKSFDVFNELFSAREKFDVRLLPLGESDRAYVFEEGVAEEIWEAVKEFQAGTYPGIDLTTENLEASADLWERLDANQVAGSVVNLKGVIELREYLQEQSGRVKARHKGPDMPDSGETTPETKRSRDQLLEGLNERPALMGEIINAGWMDKAHKTKKGWPFFDEAAGDSDKESFDDTDFCAKLLESARQLQKSIQTALILGPIAGRGSDVERQRNHQETCF